MIMYLRTVRSRMPVWGFTLIELAIVLGVAGLLFAGLYRLLSGGNQALRDQATASAQTQLINAVKGYLASTEGKTYMGNNNASTNPFDLNLPATANCTASINPLYPGFCNYLPAGFSQNTTNPYGQNYNIKIVGDGLGGVPSTYSFMIITTGGNLIPDSSGGRIASTIGGDGGFVYSNNVCNGSTSGAPTNQSACGAYGAWAVATTVYGFNGGYSGSVATRTYFSPEQDSNLPWLARYLMSTDTATMPTYNTMTVSQLFATTASGNGKAKSLYFNTNTIPAPAGGDGSIYMNGGAINMGNQLTGYFGAYGKPIYMGNINTAAGSNAASLGVGGGVLYVEGGSIILDGGVISGSGTSALNIVNAAAATNPQVNISSGCVQTSPGLPATCPYSLQVLGDANVSNFLQANALYANTFIYQSSDVRLKMNIQPITNSLGDIMQLKPVSYTLKSNGKDSMGVIAQDIEKIYPQLVTQGTGMKAVNYEGLIAPLISAVQELKHENDDLRQRIHADELRQHELEQKIKQGPN